MSELIVFGHPRSRSNLICSHINGFPKEVFDLRKVNENLQLDWSSSFNVQQSIETGRAHNYLNKLKNNLPESFKLFGFHLENWPEAFTFVNSLNYKAIRVHRENRLDAIISLLLGDKRGWTSPSQKQIKPFEVTLKQFSSAFKIVVTQDLMWESKFKFHCVLEYNEVPSAIKDGHLEKYGVSREQLYKLEDQDSINTAKQLIKNFKDMHTWNELMYKESF
jgi:hypothetical protein